MAIGRTRRWPTGAGGEVELRRPGEGCAGPRRRGRGIRLFLEVETDRDRNKELCLPRVTIASKGRGEIKEGGDRQAQDERNPRNNT